MVTRFDVFTELYESTKKIIDIVHALKLKNSDYDKVRKIVVNLTESKLISKTKHGYTAIMNPRNHRLYEMLRYCMKNSINYNDLFNESVARYLKKAFLKKSFGVTDIGIHPRTFSKISSVLEKNGFLLILSKKPFKAVVLYNSFLRDLIVHYGYRPLVAKGDNKYLENIIKELIIFNRLKNKNIRKYKEILEQFEIKFIHHSLSIEGNPITLAQTMKLLKEKIVPNNLSMESIHEVENYQKAFLQMVRDAIDSVSLTKESILNYHFIAMRHKPEWAGKIREAPVTIRGNDNFKVAEPEEIDILLERLLTNYNDFLFKKKPPLKDILDFAAFIHNEFQHIHPFYDGNSRTTRLITFHFLQMNEIPIFDIPLGFLEKYVSSTKGAQKRSDKVLANALQQIVLYNLKTINELLR